MPDQPSILGIHHIALKVKNVAEVAVFYRDVLHLEEIIQHHHDDGSLRSIWFKISDTILMIEKLDGTSSKKNKESQPHWHLVALGIKKKDRETWKKHLKSSGVVIESESQHSLYFRDTEGNRVCLSHLI